MKGAPKEGCSNRTEPKLLVLNDVTNEYEVIYDPEAQLNEGAKVKHQKRGKGIVESINFGSERAKPYCLRFNNGEFHEYGKDSIRGDLSDRKFHFDYAFGPQTPQDEIFNVMGAPVLRDVLRGYNGTILAYGQTGSGKTHTLLNVAENASEVGLVPRLATALFHHILQDVWHVYKVEMSFLQIYNEAVDDLLAMDNCNLKLMQVADPAALPSRCAVLRRVVPCCAVLQGCSRWLMSDRLP